MKKPNCYYRDWLTFPFSVELRDCVIRVDFKKEIRINVLWFHWRFFILLTKRGKEERKWRKENEQCRN